MGRESEQGVSALLQLEGDVLVTLGFELEVDHSYGYIAAEVDKVAVLEDANVHLRQKLQQTAWSFLNDSAITWTCLAVDAPLAAKAVVYAAGLFQGCVSDETLTSKGQPWWTVLETPLDVLKGAGAFCTSALPAALVELVNVFHTKETNESSEVCVLEHEVPEMETTRCGPLDDNFKQVSIDAEILLQNVEESPVSDEAFDEHTTAWLDEYVVIMKTQGMGTQSPSSPSDPCAVEKSIPLYSPRNCTMETCAEGSPLLKRSITLADSGRTIKKAKFAL
ncbi:unnamed protein product [Phytophthora lilii]|uniref:Unnamed protein product n=1 Tax=Phytophthora lilii TaxID=2077276 RepID=A0A9W6X9Z1_9STRA|nr:unnamed protein product [Phytophthora lilii]